MIKQDIIKWVDENKDMLTEMSKNIWDHPELSKEEFFASNLQKEFLKNRGFTIKEDKDIPTAFIAEYGSGEPIIGVLGEYDALKKLSQENIPERKEKVKDGVGHGCGHNLLGVACLGASVAISKEIKKGNIKGTVRYYGCPAEEMLLGKVLMADKGYFDDLDACLSWHPGSITMANKGSMLSLYSVEFIFEGKSAHAGSAPQMGRSALSAVQLMNVGANFMREHLEDETRVHYIITNGGFEPNTVPAKASVWYNIRTTKKSIGKRTFEWLVDIAKGAAQMTQTKLKDVKIISGCYEVLPNHSIAELYEKNMLALGGPDFTDEDREFSKKLSQTFTREEKEKALKNNFIPPEYIDKYLYEGVERSNDHGLYQKASTDVADVSHITPLAIFGVATWPLGTYPHIWQATAASGAGVGFHAMHYATKVLATTLVDLYTDGVSLEKAKNEFKVSTKDEKYESVFSEKLNL